MKSLSLLAATALLAAQSVQANLVLGLSNNSGCNPLVAALDVTAAVASSPDQAQCFALGTDAGRFPGINIKECTGHQQCQCELYSNFNCGSGLGTVISFIQGHQGPQFCWAGGLGAMTFKCWYID